MSTTALGREVVADRVRGCWLGKAVGGTLGQAFEGNQGMLDADFYHPVPTGMVPNDDLDLQVVFACTLAAMREPRVDARVLAQAWQRHVDFPWNEYGIGLRNLAEGLQPPHTGSFDNWFTCGEGAAIRSEVWACLAAGDPALAAAYAEQDACFDHAGDGVAAAMFLAAAEAAAFTTDDRDVVLDRGLAVIDPDSELARAITRTRAWCADPALTWQEIRARIIADFGRDDFTDVRPNTAFVVLGLLRGRDFADAICLTTNCGLDTDSSTASLGALLGIMDPGSIPQRWLAPIGEALLLNPEIHDLDHPPDLGGFTELVLDLRDRLDGAWPAPLPASPAALAPLVVDRCWYNTRRLSWEGRDLTGLPNQGTPEPDLAWVPATLPGAWQRLAAADFADDLFALRYHVDLVEELPVRVMVNCSEDFRVWLDGEPLWAAQGSRAMFPAPHMPPVGQFWDGQIGAGEHTLTVMIHRPVRAQACEWAVAIAQRPSMQHVPGALRRVAPDAGAGQ